MIDIEKFICSLLADHPVGATVRKDIHKALKDQGLEYKGGKIVPIEDKVSITESEGEKIRKYLTSFVELNSGVDLPPEDAKKILAWIEKQGEHANFRNKIRVGDKVTRNKDGILVNLSQLNRVAKKDNKQDEKGAKGNEREIPFSAWKPTDEQIEVLNWCKVKKEVDLEKEIDDYIYTHDGRKRLALELDWKCCNLTLKGGDEIIKFAKHFFEIGIKAKDWEKERMEECPYRQVECTMYEGKILECRGACSWVVDYPKLKELKAQKGE